MTEERDGDRWWNGLPEDERHRYLKAFGAMLAIVANRFQTDHCRRHKEAELLELRRVSQAADPMLAGAPAKRRGRARTCC